MSYLFSQEQEIKNDVGGSLSTYLGDSANLTAFSRLRISESRLLGDYRYMYGSGTSVQMNDLTTTGGTITADQARNCYIGAVTTTSGSRVVRQTKKYHPYTSGTSTMGLITFVMNPAKANLVQAVGMFDDLNGIFFRMNGTTPQFVIRKNGTDVEVVDQSSWNQSSMSYLDFSKAQIAIIDYQWLGVGRVRIGFVHNGVPTYAHYFYHSNVVTETYMNQPSLPFRWEIYNSGATASISSLMMICASAYVEGSVGTTSYSKSVSTGPGSVIDVNSTQGTTGVAILAIRLKNSLIGKPNRSFNELTGVSLFSTADTRYRLVVLPDSSKFLSAPTWADVPGYGWTEYATGVNMASSWDSDNNFSVLKDNFISGAGSGLGTNPEITIINNPMNAIYQNYDSTNSQVLAVIVSRLGTTNTSCRASMNWLEIK